MGEQNTPQPPAPNPVRVTLVLVTLLLALLGQIFLYTTPIDLNITAPTALWYSVVAFTLFVLVSFYKPIPALEKRISAIPIHGSVLWVFFAILLSTLAAIGSYLFEQYVLHNYIPIVSLWLIGAVSYLLAFIQIKELHFNWLTWLRTNRTELLGIGLISLAGFGMRFYQLGMYPRVINGDEGRIGLFAQGTTTGTLVNPFALWENIGALYLHAINVSISWLGANPIGLRFLAAIGGTLAIPALYLLARQISGKRVALLAAALLAMSHTHIHFSRTIAVSYIQGTWLIPLELYFFLTGLKKRSSWRAALGGILLAIHMSIYLSAQLTLGMLLVYIVIAFFLLPQEFRPAWKQALAFLGGFAITFIPEGSYMLRHPDEFLNRLNADGTFNSGWLPNEVLLTGKSTVQILAERIVHAFLSLIYYPAIEFYGSPTPMMSLITAVLLIMGLAYILAKTRSLSYLLLNGYFWGVTVAIGLFAVPPSADSYRMLIALPAAIIIASIGLEQILNFAGIDWEFSRLKYSLIVSSVMLSLLAFNVWTYYFDFVGQCRYGGDPQTRFASYLGKYVSAIESESRVYLLSDDVFRYGSHASVDFLTQKRPIINVPEPITSLNPVHDETIIASPNRVAELEAWAYANPGGQLHYNYDCANTILLAYQVP